MILVILCMLKRFKKKTKQNGFVNDLEIFFNGRRLTHLFAKRRERKNIFH